MAGVKGRSGVYKRTPEMKTGKYKRTKPGWSKGLTKETDSSVAKMSVTRTGHIVTQETRDKIREGNTGNIVSAETRDKMRESAKEKWKDFEYMKERSRFQLEQWKDPAYKKMQSETHKALWEDPLYRESQIKAVMAGNNKKPNYPEKYLFKLVDTLFPNQYLLNTKGEHARPANKRPDIINLEEKKCIEHYGCRWHADSEFWKLKGMTELNGLSLKEIHKRDKKRINLIEKAGWKVLIIWNHELKDIDRLRDKIIEFNYL